MPPLLSRKPAHAPSGPPLSATADEARFWAINNPTYACSHAHVKWTNRLAHYEADFPDERLKARLAELEPAIAQLRSLLTVPPPEWKGKEWLECRERKEKLLGQMFAIQDALRNRAARRKRGLPARGGSILSAAQRALQEPLWDPFADELPTSSA